MFDLFNLLPAGNWFNKPRSDLKTVLVCKKSGYRASVNCGETEWAEGSMRALESDQCNFCKIIFLDPSGNYRVTAARTRAKTAAEPYWSKPSGTPRSNTAIRQGVNAWEHHQAVSMWAFPIPRISTSPCLARWSPSNAVATRALSDFFAISKPLRITSGLRQQTSPS